MNILQAKRLGNLEKLFQKRHIFRWLRPFLGTLLYDKERQLLPYGGYIPAPVCDFCFITFISIFQSKFPLELFVHLMMEMFAKFPERAAHVTPLVSCSFSWVSQHILFHFFLWSLDSFGVGTHKQHFLVEVDICGGPRFAYCRIRRQEYL